jgi:probable HAF family extracellular repeat protein
MRDLGTLGGAISHANAINAGGEIVGFADKADGSWHAFLYSGGFMLDLGTLGGPHSEASGINTSGQVVGYSLLAGGANSAFIYSNGVMTALNSLLPPGSEWGYMAPPFGQAGLEQANAINDNGEIAGCAYISGAMHGFLLTLTPNLTGLSPSSVTPGGAAFTLTLTGTSFIPGATVNWNLEFFQHGAGDNLCQRDTVDRHRSGEADHNGWYGDCDCDDVAGRLAGSGARHPPAAPFARDAATAEAARTSARSSESGSAISRLADGRCARRITLPRRRPMALCESQMAQPEPFLNQEPESGKRKTENGTS